MEQTGGERSAIARRPGRPSKSEEQTITKAIISAARAQFLARGLEGAVMDTIATDAGISRNTLYTRYPTKDVLFDAVMSELFERWARKRMGRRLTNAQNPAESVRRSCQATALVFASKEWNEHQALMAAAGPQFPRYRRQSYERGYHQLSSMLAADISRLLADTPSDSRDPEMLATIIITSLYGWRQIEQSLRPSTRSEVLAFAEQLLETLCLPGL